MPLPLFLPLPPDENDDPRRERTPISLPLPFTYPTTRQLVQPVPVPRTHTRCCGVNTRRQVSMRTMTRQRPGRGDSGDDDVDATETDKQRGMGRKMTSTGWRRMSRREETTEMMSTRRKRTSRGENDVDGRADGNVTRDGDRKEVGTRTRLRQNDDGTGDGDGYESQMGTETEWEWEQRRQVGTRRRGRDEDRSDDDDETRLMAMRRDGDDGQVTGTGTMTTGREHSALVCKCRRKCTMRLRACLHGRAAGPGDNDGVVRPREMSQMTRTQGQRRDEVDGEMTTGRLVLPCDKEDATMSTATQQQQ